MAERVSQVGVEYVERRDPKLRVSQVGVEYVERRDPKLRVSQVGVEYVWPLKVRGGPQIAVIG